MIASANEQHPLVYANGILGFQGYSKDNIFCVLANGDNNFLFYGIAENSLLIVDEKQPFAQGKLNVFQTTKRGDGKDQLNGDIMKYLANKIEAEVRHQENEEPVAVGIAELSEVRKSPDVATVAATAAATTTAVVQRTFANTEAITPNITVTERGADQTE